MTDRETLPTLIRISKSKPIERDLVCPRCAGPITLEAGVLVCICGARFARLAELAVRP